MKFAMIAILSLGMMLTSCAFLDNLNTKLEEMDDAKFESLKGKVETYAELGGTEVRKKIGDEKAKKLAYTLTIILSHNNEQRSEMIADLVGDKDNSVYIRAATSAALDIVESTTGTVLDIKAILEGRKGELLESLLTGVIKGLNPEITSVTLTRNPTFYAVDIQVK